MYREEHKLLSPVGQSRCARKDIQHCVGGRRVDVLVVDVKEV